MPSSPAELPALFAFDPEEDFVLLAGDGFPSRLGPVSYTHLSKPGDTITAVVAVAIGEKLGCVVETTGTNKDPQDLIDEANFMVRCV